MRVFLLVFAVFCTMTLRAANASDIVITLDDGTTMTFAPIPAGNFMMGSPDDEEGRYDIEGPQISVDIDAFYMGISEVTQQQWIAEMPAGDRPWIGCDNSHLVAVGLQRPALCVSWEDARAFVQTLNDDEDLAAYTFRVPWEAEWEYACRAIDPGEPVSTRWFFGDDVSLLAGYAWYQDNAWNGIVNPKAHDVMSTALGALAANRWGLFDMHGNVYEWVLDCRVGLSPPGEEVPAGPCDRVLKGGGFPQHWRNTRSALRDSGPQQNGQYYFGFRVAMDVTNQPPDTEPAFPSIDVIWPPNNKMVSITIEGVTDPDGDDVTIEITGITDDEGSDPNDVGGIGSDTAQVRAQRDGKGDGRVYTISFTTSDGIADPVPGSVTVTVPHDQSGKGKKKSNKPIVGTETTPWGKIKESVK